MTSLPQTAEQIRQELERHPGDPHLVGLLADLANDAGDASRADELLDAFLAAEKVRDLLKLRHALVVRHEMAMGRLDMDIRAARKKCPHPVTKVYTGSGNNDNETICLCCGEELR